MRLFPTSVENIVLNLIYEWLGESRFNRTSEEYSSIKARLSTITIEACHAYVNQRLSEFAKAGTPPFDAISYFKPGKSGVWYKPFPKSISMETVRTALIVHGMREPRPARRRKSA